MKKILAYALVAVLLGVAAMLFPFALFEGERDMQARLSETEQAYGITSAVYPQDVLFIAFLLGISLVIALGVARHFMRKNIF